MSDSIDICLISPPNRSSSAIVPAALLYIHAWLIKNNINSKIIDIKIGRPSISLTKSQIDQAKSAILDKVKTLKPRYIGIPCYTAEFWDAIDLCKRIKAIHKCTIIVGGLHVSIKADDFFFKNSPIDMAVIGDGQYPLVEIIKRIDSGKDIDGVEGVVMRGKDGNLQIQGASSFVDWEILPNPDYSQLNMEYYSKPHTGIIRNLILSGVHIFTTIGCPFLCTFCANSNRKVRYRPIANVIEEIEELKNSYNIDSFYIFDDTFLLKKSRVIEFTEGLKNRKIGLIWAMETRVNLIDEETVKLIKQAGCMQIDFGVESGSNESLIRMKKGITEEQIIKAFDICKKYNLRTLANFMFNTPGETAEDVEKTLDIMKKTAPTRLSVCLTVPFPGTAIYNEYVEPPLTKEEYGIYNTPYLYLKVVDQRFYMARHNMDMISLRIRAIANANKLRSIMDYTFSPAYWKTLFKSKKKIRYLKVLSVDSLALLVARARNILKTYSSRRKQKTALSGRKLLVLDSSYTLEMIRDLKLSEPVLSRDLKGYFEHVWSVNPYATVVPPKNASETYGKITITNFTKEHTIIEGKIGRFNFLKRITVLNFLLSQINVFITLIRLIKKEKISAIRVTDPTYIGLFGFLLSKICGIPLIIRVTGNFDKIYEVTGKPTLPRLFKQIWIEKAIIRFVLKRADLIAGANENNRDFAIKNGAKKEHATVFRYGNLIHPVHRVPPQDRPSADLIMNELKISGDQFVIYITRLEAVKRPDHTLRVIAELKNRNKKMKAILIGDGSMRSTLVELAKKLSIGEEIIFAGNRDQEWIAAILPKALAVLSPHSGRALSEAALAGVPIVAYNFEWQPELITTGETGELVRDGDIKAMADSVMKYIDNPDYAKHVGRKVRAKALEMMDPVKLYEHERNEYEKLFNRKRRIQSNGRTDI